MKKDCVVLLLLCLLIDIDVKIEEETGVRQQKGSRIREETTDRKIKKRRESREVRKLALLIYGEATDPERSVTCHYDSAAGLGDGFHNWMGCLMGDVLSPDKAKILLNTVVVAIAAVEWQLAMVTLTLGYVVWGMALGCYRAVFRRGPRDDDDDDDDGEDLDVIHATPSRN